MKKLEDAITLEKKKYANDRPNILMLFSDEHHWKYSGYMGHPVIQTPNLDRLARTATNFTNAYCNSPLCSPSRQSFMSGRYPFRIGAWNNTSGMPETTVTWAHALSHAGYETILCGKMHFNGYQKMYGFDRRPVLEGDQFGNQFYSWGYRTSHDWTMEQPVVKSGGRENIAMAGPDSDERQPFFQQDFRITRGTLDVLREKAADSHASSPWALCVGHVLPHPPFTSRKDLWESYKGKGIVPENMYGENLSKCDQSIRAYQGLHTNEYTEDDLKRLREAYYGLVEEYDEQVGRILDCLYSTRLAENTIVFYFSDHGEMCGEHGIIGKTSLRESSVRVPMLVSWPGHFPQNHLVDTPVSLVDLYPTFLDIARTSLPDVLPLDGHSLIPLIRKNPKAFTGDGSVFCEFEGEGWNHPRCFLRQNDYKYILNHTAESELYNVTDDYLEMNNLCNNPEYAKRARRMDERIRCFWNPEKIEQEVLRTQARQKLAPVRYMCQDKGI